MQTALFQALLPEVQGMMTIPVDVDEAVITKFRIHTKRLVGVQLDILREKSKDVQKLNNMILEEFTDITESIEVKMRDIKNETDRRQAI
jgi:hypothetical protein